MQVSLIFPDHPFNRWRFRHPINHARNLLILNHMHFMNAALAKVVHDAFAARAKPIWFTMMVVDAVDTDSRQNTEPAAFMANGRPLAIAGIPMVNERTRTAE